MLKIHNQTLTLKSYLGKSVVVDQMTLEACLVLVGVPVPVVVPVVVEGIQAGVSPVPGASVVVAAAAAVVVVAVVVELVEVQEVLLVPHHDYLF